MNTQVSVTFLGAIAALQMAPAYAQGITGVNVPPPSAQSSQSVILKPTSRMPLLPDSARKTVEAAAQASSNAFLGQPGVSPIDPKQRAQMAAQGIPALLGSLNGVTPSNSGTGVYPYTTARVANFSVNTSVPNTQLNQPVTGFPYNGAGKLWMSSGSSTTLTSICSASLIGRGLVVTAAHCVSTFGGGVGSISRRVVFIPSATNGNSLAGHPYGIWDAFRIYVPSAYLNGTDTCTVSGVVCNNDIAVIELSRQVGTNLYPYGYGPVYYYSYGWNGYGDVPFLGRVANQLTQLGYPGALDGGGQMIRTDSLAVNAAPNNYQIGSGQTGGSSGGPWLVNFGTNFAVGAGASPGRTPVRNVVQATTSWGYINPSIQIQGASKFAQTPQFPGAAYGTRGAGNIGAFVWWACDIQGGQARGACF